MKSPGRVYVAPAALGLGDLVVTLPVVQSLIHSQAETWLIVRAEAHLELARHIPGIAGTILEWQFDPSKLRSNDRYYNMRNHPLQTDYWWGSDEFTRAYPNYRIDDILKHICTDLDMQVDLQHRQSLDVQALPEFADKVLFIPGSAFSFKCWPTENWLELAQSLPGECIVIGEPQQSAAVAQLLAAGLTWRPTPTLTDALNVISSARAVVSVDTGLMHLAVHQGTPTVALYRNNPVYVRRYEHVQAIVAANKCASACLVEEIACAHNTRPAAGVGFKPQDWSCLAGEQSCMRSLTIDRVRAALYAALAPAASATPAAAASPARSAKSAS